MIRDKCNTKSTGEKRTRTRAIRGDLLLKCLIDVRAPFECGVFEVYGWHPGFLPLELDVKLMLVALVGEGVGLVLQTDAKLPGPIEGQGGPRFHALHEADEEQIQVCRQAATIVEARVLRTDDVLLELTPDLLALLVRPRVPGFSSNHSRARWGNSNPALGLIL